MAIRAPDGANKYDEYDEKDQILGLQKQYLNVGQWNKGKAREPRSLRGDGVSSPCLLIIILGINNQANYFPPLLRPKSVFGVSEPFHTQKPPVSHVPGLPLGPQHWSPRSDGVINGGLIIMGGCWSQRGSRKDGIKIESVSLMMGKAAMTIAI